MDVDYGVCGMVFAVLALIVVGGYQIQTGAPVRLRSRKCTSLHRLQSLRTLRFELIHQPAPFVRPQGRLRLRIAAAPPVRRRFQKALARLPDAA